jgi:predicted dehydrogenase
VGVLQATTSAYPGYPRRVELTGTEGTVVLDHDRLFAADLRNPVSEVQSLGDDQNSSSNSATVSDVRGHRAVLEDFIQSIQTDRDPRCSGLEGIRSLALVEAIYEACRLEKRVEVKG